MAGRDDTPILLSPPHTGERERELLLEAFDSNWIAPNGPQVRAFEDELAARIGAGHAAALSSGTAGLHLALVTLDVGAGDEVWTSTLTFAATANAIRYVGATPVFVDADPAGWTLDAALLAERLDERARTGRLPAAVIAVDVYGQCADYDPIVAACRRHGVALIEDASQALGATYRGRAAGTFGDLGVFSFNGNKIVTTGGGGMLVSPDRERIERARKLASNARDDAPHYEHSTVGFNYAMSNLAAAVGRAQLETLDARVAARRANNAAYREALGAIAGIGFMPEASYGDSTFWLTAIVVDERACGIDRGVLYERLASRRIESRPVMKPMHLQPAFAAYPAFGGAVAAGLFDSGLCLPSGSNLKPAQIRRVCQTVAEACGARLAKGVGNA